MPRRHVLGDALATMRHVCRARLFFSEFSLRFSPSGSFPKVEDRGRRAVVAFFRRASLVRRAVSAFFAVEGILPAVARDFNGKFLIDMSRRYAAAQALGTFGGVRQGRAGAGEKAGAGGGCFGRRGYRFPAQDASAAQGSAGAGKIPGLPCLGPGREELRGRRRARGGREDAPCGPKGEPRRKRGGAWHEG